MTEEKKDMRPVALVMAASRRGADDPVAKLQQKSHKCLVEIDGTVMLEIVVRALIDSGCFRALYISIESEDVVRRVPQLSEWLDEGKIAVTESRGNLADSVIKAVNDIGDAYPLVITTGDNALHTTELVRDFVTQFNAGDGDAAVAFTSGDVVLQDFANSGLAFHRLKDGQYSADNLYALRRPKALQAVRIFEGGGQFGKRHLRILKAFGLAPFILYKFQWATLDQLMQRIARNLGITCDTILLPYSFAPIDVDNAHSFTLTAEFLKTRRLGT